ncbi:MAG: type II toxin-antitoxin system RelE/ParE family toxin [Thermomicrobiales bacterium]
MIATIRHKGLKRFYETGDRSKLPPEMVDRIRRILLLLDVAIEAADVAQPTMNLHQLQGTLRGHYAVTVRANWRITFRIENGHVHDVDFLDYH